MPYQTPPWTQVIAHRGNSGPLPENTLVAIESAIGLGVDMVEVDIRLTGDGVPILMHHDRVDRTTSGTGPVSGLTWDEIKALDGGSWRGPEFADQTVQSLEEVLDSTRGRVALNLDIQVPEAAVPTVLAVIEADSSSNVVISGCTADCVKTVGKIASGISTLFNLDDLLREIDPAAAPAAARQSIDLAVDLGAVAINVPHPLVDVDLVEQAREAGIGVWAFTIDDAERFLHLMNAGVASLTTNWPDRMLPLVPRATSQARIDGS
jgi:glycerophosphoryl diester phosphodiesterase